MVHLRYLCINKMLHRLKLYMEEIEIWDNRVKLCVPGSRAMEHFGFAIKNQQNQSALHGAKPSHSIAKSSLTVNFPNKLHMCTAASIMPFCIDFKEEVCVAS